MEEHIHCNNFLSFPDNDILNKLKKKKGQVKEFLLAY